MEATKLAGALDVKVAFEAWLRACGVSGVRTRSGRESGRGTAEPERGRGCRAQEWGGGGRQERGVRGGGQATDVCVCMPLGRMVTTSNQRCT